MFCGRLSKKAKPKIDPQITQMGADSRQPQTSLIDYLLGSICVNQRNLRIHDFTEFELIKIAYIGEIFPRKESP
jgi:hypothetical protein